MQKNSVLDQVRDDNNKHSENNSENIFMPLNNLVSLDNFLSLPISPIQKLYFYRK